MKKLKLAQFFLLLGIGYVFLMVVALFWSEANAQTFVEAQSNQGSNLLRNAGFESGRGAWTISAGTFSNANSEYVPPGKYSGRFSLSAYTGTLLEQTISNCSKLSGKNLEASISVKTSSLNVQVCSMSGGTEVQCLSSSSLDSFVPVVLNFPAPSSGSCGIRVKTTASTTGDVFLDEAYLGPARNIGTVAQAQHYGGVRWPMAANCSWSVSATAYTSYSADSDCTTPTGTNVTGFASAPATKIPAITFATLPPGRYQFVASGRFRKAGTTSSTSSCWRFNDGTTGMQGACASANTTSVGGIGTITGSIEYTTAQTAITIQLQGLSDAAAEAALISNDLLTSSVGGLWIDVYRFPLASETSIRPIDAAWYVDATISGANPSLGTSSITSYTEITDAGLTLTPTSGSAPVGIMCSSTNAAATPSSSATVCTSGSESLGINASIPYAGLFEVCMAFSNSVSVASTGVHGITFQISETGTASQTDIYTGLTRSNTRLGTVSGTSGQDAHFPHQLCEVLNFSSTGLKGIRLKYTQGITNTVNSSAIIGDASGTSNGGRNIRITMKPWLSPMPAPLLTSSVTYSDTVKSEGAQGLNTVATGIFTGTGSNLVNLDATPAPNFVFSRIGDTVNYSFSFSADITTATTTSGFQTTVPIASNFSATSDGLGVCTTDNGQSFGRVIANVANDRLQVTWLGSTTLAAIGWNCSGSYIVK